MHKMMKRKTREPDATAPVCEKRGQRGILPQRNFRKLQIWYKGCHIKLFAKEMRALAP